MAAFQSVIGIENRQGTWRLNLPREWARQIYGQSQKRILTFYKATPENYQHLLRMAIVMEEDYHRGEFDCSLKKYKVKKASKPSIQVDVATQPAPVSLSAGYNYYCEHIKPTLAASTYKKVYKKIYLARIQKIETMPIHEVYGWVVNNNCVKIARNFLSVLEKLGNFLIRKGISPYGEKNPFAGFTEDAKQLRRREPQPEEELTDSLAHLSLLANLELLADLTPAPDGLPEEIDPQEFEDCRSFPVEDVETIIEAFSNSRYSYLVPIIVFLFLSGCRPSEACELRWRDIYINPVTRRSSIKIHRSYSLASGETQPTKTYAKRSLPLIDPCMIHLIQQLIPENVQGDDLIFTTPDNKRINISTLSQIWGAKNYNGKPGIVRQLATDGKISTYLKLYATRHTFINLQFRAHGTEIVVELAYWVGNSPATILKHYVDARRRVIPAFVYQFINLGSGAKMVG